MRSKATCKIVADLSNVVLPWENFTPLAMPVCKWCKISPCLSLGKVLHEVAPSLVSNHQVV